MHYRLLLFSESLSIFSITLEHDIHTITMITSLTDSIYRTSPYQTTCMALPCSQLQASPSLPHGVTPGHLKTPTLLHTTVSFQEAVKSQRHDLYILFLDEGPPQLETRSKVYSTSFQTQSAPPCNRSLCHHHPSDFKGNTAATGEFHITGLTTLFRQLTAVHELLNIEATPHNLLDFLTCMKVQVH